MTAQQKPPPLFSTNQKAIGLSSDGAPTTTAILLVGLARVVGEPFHLHRATDCLGHHFVRFRGPFVTCRS